MRKILVGGLLGLTLIGSQAVAAGAAQPIAVGDRVGAVIGASGRNFQSGLDRRFSLNNPVVFVGIVVTAIALPIVFNNDDDDSTSN